MTKNKKNRLKRSLAKLMALVMLYSACMTSAYAATDSEEINWVSLYGDVGTSSVATTCDSVNDAITISDGSIVAAGAFDGSKSANMEGLKGKTDAAFMAYDKEGNLQSQTFVGGTKADYFYEILDGAYGGYVAVGASQSEDGELEGLLKGGYDGLAVSFDGENKLTKVITVGGSDKDELKNVINALDGGYVAVGYTHSTDGDLANSGKTSTDRDAMIVKLNKDLEIEWIKTAGYNGVLTELDEFNSVVICADGSYIAAGYAGTSENGKEVFAVKYSEAGEQLWVKTYGGIGDDVANDIVAAPHKRGSVDREESDIASLQNGFVLAGTTDSDSGDFTGSQVAEGEADKAFLMKINNDGEIVSVDMFENTSGATGESLLVIGDGYLMTGTYKNNDLDFTGQSVFGKEDIFVAHYSSQGDFLNMSVFGGDDKDTVKGLSYGGSDDYLLYGNVKGDTFHGQTRQGKYDGFLMSVKAEALETYAEEQYLVPVVAWKADADENSMMAPLLYGEAYVQKTGNRYETTVYFINAKIMGVEVSAASLGNASYERNGEMIPADSDVYDTVTQVKSVTITLGGLSEPVGFFIEDTMGSIRLKFDESAMKETDTPPYFAPVEIAVPDFQSTWKTNVGGSDVDYAMDVTVLSNGNTIVGGETYSNDLDFEGKLTGRSAAYINEYDSEGKFIKATLLGGSDPNTVAYVMSLDAADDGGFFAGGGYYEQPYVDPSGDFAALKTENSVHGLTDAFLAKYDKQGNQTWMVHFGGSQHDQIKDIKATVDGGCAMLVESNSTDGDLTDQQRGLFDLVLVKYDKNGQKEWQRMLGGRNIESAAFGLDILEDGSYIVGGYLGSKSGDFADVEYYGDTFDLFAAKISTNGELLWTKAYGGDKNDYCYGMVATEDGGFMMLGKTKSTTDTFAQSGTGYDNAFIMKCDAKGNVEWTDVIKSSDISEASYAIELDDKFLILGNSYGLDFDFKNLNKGSKDVFVAEYTKDGQRTSMSILGGTAVEESSKMVLSEGKNVTLIASGASNDGDMEGMNRGQEDGTLVRFEVEVQKQSGIADSNNDVNKDNEDKQIVADSKDKAISGETPSTGDNVNVSLWMTVLLAAILSAVVIMIKKEKQNRCMI